MLWILAGFSILPVTLAAALSGNIEISVNDVTAPNIVNVHLIYHEPDFKKHSFTYGSCDIASPVNSLHRVATIPSGPSSGHDSRLVWVVPDNVSPGGCIAAWDMEGARIGQSEPLSLDSILQDSFTKRDRIPMTNESGIDAEGPWFNGVTLLKSKDFGAVDAKKIKEKSIGILGAGISGLMTHFLLQSVGFQNIEISESTGRVGGRIRTEYFELPESNYQYQEMGAMRIPLTAPIPLGNETLTLNFTTHRIVFQLSETLNELNKQHESFKVDWIPFIQNSDNALSLNGKKRNPDGSIPTIGDVSKNSSLGASTIHTAVLEKLNAELGKIMYDPSMMKLIASNVYEAHKKFLDVGLNGRGGDQWSQVAYLHNLLGFDLNTTEIAGDLSNVDAPFWVNLYDNLFFSSTEWKTVDKGMSRLPNAFKPLVGDDLKYHRKIQKIEYLEDEKKVQVSWKKNYTDRGFQNAKYDYTFVAVPFTVVRKWELPDLSTTLSHAVASLGYTSACKVALEFKTRFWEHLSRPIFGSCNTKTDIPGIGNVCYPGFNMNSSGPAVILGSYNLDDYGERWVSTPEKEHAQYVLDAFAQLHGDIVYEQYTGNFKRLCWLEEESNAGGSWAFPSLGQHQLFIPSYFNTEKNIIFIGEHTSYTHSWIASALESSVRGTVQLLLEMGLVDEAKEITRTWMGRWVTV
ncbi:hypothetical protein N7509_011085 [Penicillium cosmopolitanum]|uniref:Amine oxidase domain-containing protein n=1 Tax=Penicillium cosmopolitanum TaxID=1131564 RepID=A0A9W9VSU3_9EURO|nr:uncharacterized protein N7509_011085 [Penicillium cosmopolitanum]KAJ5388544.1 hypothetical protein N7509_011085 [Penicillium cosmopolitanum]